MMEKLEKLRVAGSPATPPEVLSQLAKDPSWEVRKEVGRNACAPLEVLEELGRDPEELVRF